MTNQAFLTHVNFVLKINSTVSPISSPHTTAFPLSPEQCVKGLIEINES